MRFFFLLSIIFFAANFLLWLKWKRREQGLIAFGWGALTLASLTRHPIFYALTLVGFGGALWMRVSSRRTAIRLVEQDLPELDFDHGSTLSKSSEAVDADRLEAQAKRTRG